MDIIHIFRTIVLIFVAMFITTFRSLYAPAFFRCVTGSNQRLYPLYHVSLSVSSIPDEGSGELSEGKLTGDNW